MSWEDVRSSLIGRAVSGSPVWLRGLVWKRLPISSLRRALIVDLVRWQYGILNETGIPPTALASPDIELHQAPELMGTAGTFHGHAGVQELWAELLDAWGSVQFQPRVIREFGNGAGVVVVVQARNVGLGSGIVTDREVAHVYRVDRRTGGITHMDTYWDPVRAFEAVGLDP